MEKEKDKKFKRERSKTGLFALLLLLPAIGLGVFGLSNLMEEKGEIITVRAEASNGIVEGAGEYRVGDEVTLRFVAGDNYKFAGWVDLGAPKQEVVSASNPFVFRAVEDVYIGGVGILISEQSVHVHTPVHIGNGDVRDMSMMFVVAEDAEEILLRLDDFEVPHFEFDGWYLERTGEGYGEHPEYDGYTYTTEVDGPALDAKISELAGGILHIYGKATPIIFTVTYDLMEGNWAEAVDTRELEYRYLEGDTVTLFTDGVEREHENPTKIWVFDGWFRSEDEGVTMAGDAIVTFEISEDEVFYAKWTEADKLSGVINWMNGGELAHSDDEYYHNDLIIDPVVASEIAAPEKAQDAKYTYEFAGWSEEEDGDLIDFANFRITFLTEGAEVSIYAVYTSTERTYAIAINDKDGNELHAEDLLYSEIFEVEVEEVPVAVEEVIDGIIAAEEIAEPETYIDYENRYEFEDWDVTTDEELGTVTVTPDFAEIALEDYTVTVKVTLRTVAETTNEFVAQTIKFGVREEYIPDMPTFAVPGFNFAGVFTDAGHTTKYVNGPLANDITLHALLTTEALIPTIDDVVGQVTAPLSIENLVLPDVAEEGLVDIEVLESPFARIKRAIAYDLDSRVIRVTYEDATFAAAAHGAYVLGEEYDGNGVRVGTLDHKVEITYSAEAVYFDIKVSTTDFIDEDAADIVIGLIGDVEEQIDAGKKALAEEAMSSLESAIAGLNVQTKAFVEEVLEDTLEAYVEFLAEMIAELPDGPVLPEYTVEITATILGIPGTSYTTVDTTVEGLIVTGGAAKATSPNANAIQMNNNGANRNLILTAPENYVISKLVLDVTSASNGKTIAGQSMVTGVNTMVLDNVLTVDLTVAGATYVNSIIVTLTPTA